MSRLVLDTNTLIQCTPLRSKYHDIWLSFFDGRNYLCVTTEILEEYEEILDRLSSPTFASFIMDAIVSNSHTILATPYFQYHFITSDPDDDKFVDCAIAANAKFIVTEDHHYNVLKDVEFPRVDIIGLDDYLSLLEQRH